jgi:hypothetical protein
MCTPFIHWFIKVLMRNTLIISSVLLIMLGLSGTAMAGEAISVRINAGGIQATALVADVSSVVIRIAGPDDFFDEVRSSTGSVYWSNIGWLPDGLYRYDAYVTVDDASDGEDKEDDRAQMYRESGRFNIEGGQLFDSAAMDGSEKSGLWQDVTRRLARLVGSVLNALVTDAHAADLNIVDDTPTLFWQDNTTAETFDWHIAGWGDSGGGFFRLFEDGSILVLDIQSSANNINSLIVDDNGDISFANETVFIDRSLDRVGVGTTSPSTELHILSSTPAIRLDDGGTGIWEITENSNDLRFNDIASSIYNVLVLDGNTQNVGIGTSTPQAKLDILGTDSNNSFRLQVMGHTGGTSHAQIATNQANSRLTIMASSYDDYAPRLAMVGPQDAGASKGWAVFDFGSNNVALPGAQFHFRHAGGDGSFISMMQIFGRNAVTFPTGNVGIATTNPVHRIQVTTGGAWCDGTNWVDVSTREAKDNILELKTEEALETLKNMKPVKFNYKQDSDKEINLGFIAEDVPDLVATKGRKGMVSMEVVAVLTKVVQQQQELILSQQKAFDEQKEVITQLTERIDNLEER